MKRVFALCVILAMLLLAGCGTKATAVDSSGAINLPIPEVVTDPGASQTPPTAGTIATPGSGSQGILGSQATQVQLLVGLLGLEGTDLALNAIQATSILPALTVLQDETPSGPIPSEKLIELDAYIRSILSTEQSTAIADMNLSLENMAVILEPYSISLSHQTGSGNGGPQGALPSGDPGNQGAMLQGTPPEGQTSPAGGSPPVGGNGNPQGDSTGRGGGMNALPNGLLDALIQLLQTRASS